MTKFSGDFGNLKERFIDDHILLYMGLDKAKVEKEYGSTFDFVNSFLHNKVFNLDLDLYGDNARPFHNVINGVNELIDAGLDVRVLTSRNIGELDEFVNDKEKNGIVAKTHRFVECYLTKVSDITIVDRTKLKKPYAQQTDIWIDDDYSGLIEELKAANVYIVKNQFPRNEDLLANSVITDRSKKKQKFVKDVIKYAEKTGLNRVITDLDDTLVEFKGCYKEVCDYAMKHYPGMFDDLKGDV